MKYCGVVISVKDIKASRKFYEDLFGLEVYQDYGRNIMFSGGLALQQDFDWLVNIPKEKILKDSNNMELFFDEENFDDFVERLKNFNVKYLHGVFEHDWGQRVIRFYDIDGHLIEVGENMKMVIDKFIKSGLSLAQISEKMDITMSDLEKLIND